MRQLLIRVLNLALVAVCSFQGAKVVNLAAARILQPEPTYTTPDAAGEERTRSEWEAREIILERNLFGAKILDDAALAPVESITEEIEETKLPLVLEGTVAGPTLAASQAAILDTRSRESMVLRIGDPLEGYAEVSVALIERGRVVLQNRGRREELLLNEPEVTSSDENGRGDSVAATRASASRSARTPRTARRPSSRARGADARADRIRDLVGQHATEELTMEQITAEIEELQRLEEQ